MRRKLASRDVEMYSGLRLLVKVEEQKMKEDVIKTVDHKGTARNRGWETRAERERIEIEN